MIKEKLDKLISEIKKIGQFAFQIITDTKELILQNQILQESLSILKNKIDIEFLTPTIFKKETTGSGVSACASPCHHRESAHVH